MIQYAETPMDELDRLRLLDARLCGHDRFRDAST
jgi:hypothetical protein